MITTKELIDWVKNGVWTEYNIEYLEEIVQRLRELDDLQKACREMLRGVRALGVGQLVQVLPKNHNKK